MTRLLSTREEAKKLGISHRTLEGLRLKGGGPPFVKLGRSVRYDETDVDMWLASRRRRSTSDPGGEL